MTNNPTIDGVSRATIEKGFDVIEGFVVPTIKVSLPPCHVDDDESWNSRDAISGNIRALLDADIPASVAPAVERCTSCDDSGDLTDLTGEWRGYCTCPIGEALKNKPAVTPEVAALRSTIAQVEGKLNKAIDLDFQRRETIEQLQAHIAELESGRCEPVAWLNLERVSCGMAYATNEKVNNLQTALYTAPPAPVAVVLPKREMFHGEMDNQEIDFNRGWNACLDATSALNEVKK